MICQIRNNFRNVKKQLNVQFKLMATWPSWETVKDVEFKHQYLSKKYLG